MNLEDTEEIKLSEEPISFGFGLTVNNTNSDLSDLFKYRVEFRKNNEQKKTINYNKCDLSDFHNLHEKYLNQVNIEDYYCISHDDLSDNSPEGIYTGISFSYYMISLEYRSSSFWYSCYLHGYITKGNQCYSHNTEVAS